MLAVGGLSVQLAELGAGAPQPNLLEHALGLAGGMNPLDPLAGGINPHAALQLLHLQQQLQNLGLGAALGPENLPAPIAQYMLLQVPPLLSLWTENAAGCAYICIKMNTSDSALFCGQ